MQFSSTTMPTTEISEILSEIKVHHLRNLRTSPAQPGIHLQRSRDPLRGAQPGLCVQAPLLLEAFHTRVRSSGGTASTLGRPLEALPQQTSPLRGTASRFPRWCRALAFSLRTPSGTNGTATMFKAHIGRQEGSLQPPMTLSERRECAISELEVG